MASIFYPEDEAVRFSETSINISQDTLYPRRQQSTVIAMRAPNLRMQTASCTLNMESSYSSETSLKNCQTRRHHMPLESVLVCHFQANRKSHSTNNSFFHEDRLMITRNVGKLTDYTTSHPRKHNGGFIILPNDGSGGVFLTFLFLTTNILENDNLETQEENGRMTLGYIADRWV